MDLVACTLLSIMLATLCTLKLTQGQLGVVYSPFVKPEDSPTSESYTLEDVKVMMDLVKYDNFKFVATYGVGAPNEPYKLNQTRYHSSSVVHTALAAAEINKKATKSTEIR
ncbi:hypothetical protein Ocin01_20060 [Orchesella cincta]|uniref:Uncharacterized protein n=1 Tax=Orchesella cincta TaxID=48709 RepID=A0A1D2M124_ORCCI|nr:hypothetical protein Ocin01_20060 [Orchesella cincta]